MYYICALKNKRHFIYVHHYVVTCMWLWTWVISYYETTTTLLPQCNYTNFTSFFIKKQIYLFYCCFHALTLYILLHQSIWQDKLNYNRYNYSFKSTKSSSRLISYVLFGKYHIWNMVQIPKMPGFIRILNFRIFSILVAAKSHQGTLICWHTFVISFHFNEVH